MLRNVDGRVAFLCYHSIATPGPAYLSVPPDTFEAQLATLRRRGWRTGAERELEAVAAGVRPDAPTAFLTFDDGYVDNHASAFPLLRAYGQTAIVFVLPPAVDAGGPLLWSGIEDAVRDFPDVMRSMTWAMVEEMAEHGVTFGSHTIHHPHLDRIDGEQLREELLESRRRIAERLGSCNSIAYPYGDWDGRVRLAARDAGYRWAFTIPRDGQRDVDALSIPRLAVDRRDVGRRFELKLRPATRGVLLSPLASLVVRPAASAARLAQRGAGRSSR